MRVPALIMLFVCAGYSLHAFEPAKAKVTANVLNVRDLPSAGGDVIATLKRGDILDAIEESKQEVTIDGQTAHWYKVTLPKKKTGWVFGGYISFEVNLEAGLQWKIAFPSSGEKFTGVAVNAEGAVYTGTSSGNIYISNAAGKWKKITPQALGISIGAISKILISGKVIYATSADKKSGGVWKSTNSGSSWAQYTESQGLPSNEVYDIRVRGTELWVATGKGIAYSSLTADQWVIMGPETPAPCRSVAVSSEGIVLAGTTKGLYKLSTSTGTFSSGKLAWSRVGERAGNLGDTVSSLLFSDSGVLFIGTNKGLVMGDKDAVNLYAIGGETVVNHIASDSAGRILVATRNGLNISLDQGKSWITYKDEHGIRGGATYQISVGSKQEVWVSLESQGLAYSQ